MISRVAAGLVLPPHISALERARLSSLNRIALVALILHMPLLMFVAALAGTSVVRASVLACAVLAGPLLASRGLDNPRWVARVMSFAAMCMGGVLVHVGQGPMQIEMHFYFFVVIALLAVFADPLVIVVAAATVALHHVALFALLPSSVFNYEASGWAVVVHAAFVVIESTAACFVARSFHDNVIGLETIVGARTCELASRNDQMRVLLDNLEAGLVTCDHHGRLSAERSAVLERWLGDVLPTDTLWSYVGRSDPAAAMWLETTFEMLRDGVLPVELALGQLPARIRAGSRILALRTRALGAIGLPRVLVILSDVTNEVTSERLEAEQRDLVTLSGHAVKDAYGFDEFMDESTRTVATVLQETEPRELSRLLHTLKGNCATFGASVIASRCHTLEDRLAENGELEEPDRLSLADAWSTLATKLGLLRGDRHAMLDVRRSEHDDAVRRLQEGASRAEIAELIEHWRCERASVRFGRLAEQAQGLAQRLGRPRLEVVVDDQGLRLPDLDLSAFWSAFVHVVRNAVDHGIESAAERVAAGKPAHGTLTFRASREAGAVRVELADDGRGVDWAVIADRARRLGLPAATREDLVAALFVDGLTSRTETSALSGRGVGMSAVRAECKRIGAVLTVNDVPGGGTCVRVSMPVDRRTKVGTARDVPVFLSFPVAPRFVRVV